MKKIIGTYVMLASISGIAENADFNHAQSARDEWTKAHFQSQGGPVPDGGVQVIPEKQMSSYKDSKARLVKEKADIKKYGYIRRDVPEVQSLLNAHIAAKNAFSNGGTGSSSHSEMQKSVDDIEMAYPYRGVPVGSVTKIIGAVPSVTYIKGQGWAGAAEIFEKGGLGNCIYRQNNLKFSHGSIIVAREKATYDVNSKVTIKEIIGTPKQGFIYHVEWHDSNFFNDLDCANKIFDKNLLKAAVEMATQIDNNR